MHKNDLSEYKRRYQAFRHHAWAGLGFLSVFLAIRLILPEPSEILTPIIVILSIYVLIALIFTYKYRSGLTTEEKPVIVQPSVEAEKAKIDAKVEKEHLKVKKKKAKSIVKKSKKKK